MLIYIILVFIQKMVEFMLGNGKISNLLGLELYTQKIEKFMKAK